MGWHWTTCLLCAALQPNSLDARIFALRIADSSTFHALHCRRAVFEPSRMLVHLCGTFCPFISRTAIWLLQLSCAILSLISFLSTDFVLSVRSCRDKMSKSMYFNAHRRWRSSRDIRLRDDAIAAALHLPQHRPTLWATLVWGIIFENVDRF